MSNTTTTTTTVVRRQICLFGTSANPPTGSGGHVGIVQALSSMPNTTKFDEIRILPVYQHTFSSKRNQLVSYEHRVNMCKIAFEGIPRAIVSNAEEESFQRVAKDKTEEEKQSLRVGTADLLEMLIAQEPDSDFTFCLGSDTFFDLTEWKWRRSKDILKLLQGRMVVLHRRGVVDAVQRQYPESLQERVDKVNTITLTENNSNEKVILLEVPSLGAVSSSLVRSSCRDEAQVEQLVAEGVLKYIKEHRLYGFSTDLDTITQDNSEKQRTRDI